MAAARNLQQNWPKNLTEPMARLNEVLVRTESAGQPKNKIAADACGISEPSRLNC
jgi:hypothetical protein